MYKFVYKSSFCMHQVLLLLEKQLANGTKFDQDQLAWSVNHYRLIIRILWDHDLFQFLIL